MLNLTEVTSIRRGRSYRVIALMAADNPPQFVLSHLNNGICFYDTA